jgi:predicted Fe-Mo cluster-binding NifX family protein
MKIAVTSQNFRTITGHAGKTRRFLVFEPDASGNLRELERIDLPKDMSMHEFRGDVHPIDAVDVLITGGCGAGFIRKMAARGVDVLQTAETDPRQAVHLLLSGCPLTAASAEEDAHGDCHHGAPTA